MSPSKGPCQLLAGQTHFRPISLLTWASLTCSFWLLLPLESMKGEISFTCTTFCIVSNVSTCPIASHVGKILSAHPPPLIHHLSVPVLLFLLLYFLNSALLQPTVYLALCRSLGCKGEHFAARRPGTQAQGWQTKMHKSTEGQGQR